MTRFAVHFVLLLTLVFGTIYSSASAALFLEDKLKELESRLETKINLLEAKNVLLEDMVTQLKTQLEKKVSTILKKRFLLLQSPHFTFDIV
jgi:hypothetical protein